MIARRALLACLGVLLLAVVTVCSILIVHFIDDRHATDNKLLSIANTNQDNGQDIKAALAILNSATGPDAQIRQAAATKKILRDNAEEVDCRSRRQQVRLPAPPNPDVPCKDQTDPSVYPGVAGQPAKGP